MWGMWCGAHAWQSRDFTNPSLPPPPEGSRNPGNVPLPVTYPGYPMPYPIYAVQFSLSLFLSLSLVYVWQACSLQTDL